MFLNEFNDFDDFGTFDLDPVDVEKGNEYIYETFRGFTYTAFLKFQTHGCSQFWCESGFLCNVHFRKTQKSGFLGLGILSKSVYITVRSYFITKPIDYIMYKT